MPAKISRFIFNEEPSGIVSDMDYDIVMKTDRLTSAILRFPSGKTATFTCSSQLMAYQQTNIFWDRGQITVDIPVNAPPDKSVRIILKTKEKIETIEIDPVDQYALQAIYLQGLPEMNLNNILLENLAMESEKGMLCIDARGITIKGLNLITAEYPALTFFNAKDVIVEGLELRDTSQTGIYVNGDESVNITINGKPIF